jgi:hypothetical protein
MYWLICSVLLNRDFGVQFRDFRAVCTFLEPQATQLPMAEIRRESYETQCFPGGRRSAMTRALRYFSLLVLVSLAGVAALSQESREVHKSGAFDRNGTVVIDTYKGSVDVTVWDKSEIDILARIEADGSGRRSREKVRDTEVLIDLGPKSARIKTDYEGVRRSRDSFFDIFNFEGDNLPYVHYTIKVPRTVSLEIKDYKSTTTVEGLQSSFEIDSYKGDIGIRKHEGSVNLKTYKGKARVDFVRLEGRSRAETYKGELDISLPHGQGFELDADIGRRARISSDFDLGRDRYRDRRSGYDVRVAVNGGGPMLRLKCDKGTVRLVER